MVAAVTAIDTPTGINLLGIWVSDYDDSPEQVKSLANPNVFVCDIDECSKQRGGRQSLLTNSGEIPIDLEEGRLPYTYIRKPTTEDIKTKEIVWAVPFQPNSLDQATTRIKAARNMKIHVDKGTNSDFNIQPDIPKCTGRNPILDSGPTAPLAVRLANCPIDISNQNLLATTQMRAGDIDMDHQEITRMNLKKRGVPFAQWRLEGPTDSDTLFLSVKSIRGLGCVQLFVQLLKQFIWIPNLRREKDNHGA